MCRLKNKNLNMNTKIILILLITLVISKSCTIFKRELSEDEKKQILNYHNEIREQVASGKQPQ